MKICIEFRESFQFHVYKLKTQDISYACIKVRVTDGIIKYSFQRAQAAHSSSAGPNVYSSTQTWSLLYLQMS